MCSPGKGDCRIPSRWKAVYPPRSEPSVASRRCWRADRVEKPNVCVYSHSLGNVKFAPSHSPEFAPRRSIRLPLDAYHASSGTPGPLRFPNARALSLPGAPPTPTRVRRAVSIGRIEPGHSLVKVFRRALELAFRSINPCVGTPIQPGSSSNPIQENHLVRF